MHCCSWLSLALSCKAIYSSYQLQFKGRSLRSPDRDAVGLGLSLLLRTPAKSPHRHRISRTKPSDACSTLMHMTTGLTAEHPLRMALFQTRVLPYSLFPDRGAGGAGYSHFSVYGTEKNRIMPRKIYPCRSLLFPTSC